MRNRTHKSRDDLTGEHLIGDAGQAIFACLFFSAWIADTFFLKITTFLDACVPVFVKTPIGIIVLIIAAYLSWNGLSIVFSEVREKPEVIRKGVFGIVRHPIYLSEILLYLGLLIFSISLAAASIWLLAILFLYYISRHEEKLLLERFKDEYKKYMKEVPMWIPRLSVIFKRYK